MSPFRELEPRPVAKVYVTTASWHGPLRLYAWPEGVPGMQFWCLLPLALYGETTMERVARWMKNLPKKSDARRPFLTKDWRLVEVKREPRSAFDNPEEER